MTGFRAAAAEVDLLAPVGSWLSGFALRVSPSDGQHDALMARALLLHDGAQALLIITLDIIGMTTRDAAELRTRIGAAAGIPAHAVVLACSHTHSAPATMPFRGVLGYLNVTWWEQAKAAIVALAAALPRKLREARLRIASTQVIGISYNRQDRARPIDTELLVLAVEGVRGGTIATAANFAVHPVTLSHGNLKLSGDVPGEVSRQLAAATGGIGLYLQGACGDVNPSIDLKRGWGNGTFADVAAMGRRLSDAALRALKTAEPMRAVRLRSADMTTALPLDRAPSSKRLDGMLAQFQERLDKARAVGDMAEQGFALSFMRWSAEVRAAMVTKTLPRVQPLTMWTASINDLRLLAVPLEPYSDIALGFKRAVLPEPGCVVGYANGLIGYCASDWAKAQGGYGPDEASRWFPEQLLPIGRGAVDQIVRAATR